MRFYNTTFKTLLGVSALLVCGGAARAQTSLVDTIGSGARWGIGLTRTNAAPVGYDSGGNGIAPAAPAQSGYAVLPFTIADGVTINSLSEVDIVFNIQQGTGATSNLPSLSGAIVPANAVGSLSLTGLSASSFFSFDTSPNRNPNQAAFPNSGDGITHVFSAANFGSYTLTGNQTYWLVIAPKAGLAAQAGDPLLDYGLWNSRLATDVTASGGSLNSAFAAVGQGLAETQGANAGDTLTGTTLGRARQATYFGARISGNAVPEPSGLLALAGGLVMAGALLIRRRK